MSGCHCDYGVIEVLVDVDRTEYQVCTDCRAGRLLAEDGPEPMEDCHG